MTPEKMKIAMLSVHSCPVGMLGARDTGGMSVYIRELAREMGRLGHTVDVFTRVHDPNDPVIIGLGDNARLIHLMAGGIEQINKLDIYPHLPSFTEELDEFRRQDGGQYDLIYSNYWLSGLAGQHLAGLWNVPHLVIFHTLGAMKNAAGIGPGEPELRLEQEGVLARECSRIIAPTEREKENLVRFCSAAEERIAVVPCGINLERFQPVDRTEARRRLGIGEGKVVLFVGRFDPLKGIDRLFEAAALLKKSQPVDLLLVGGDGGKTLNASEERRRRWAWPGIYALQGRSGRTSFRLITARLTFAPSLLTMKVSGWLPWNP